jgi:hypothetical protein
MPGDLEIMSDEEILQDYVRVRVTAARIFIEVRMEDPGWEKRLAIRWSLAMTLPRASTPLQVGRARMLTLVDHRYFRVCDTCGLRLPSGRVNSNENGTENCRDCIG